MREVRGNLWDFHEQGFWVVITTNGSIKINKCAVMGRGVAKEAAQRFPKLPSQLGRKLQTLGNILIPWPEYRLFTFPVKHRWMEKANLDLIEMSTIALSHQFTGDDIYSVRPGCGNGGLDWKDVKPILEKYLDDRFIIVEINIPEKVTQAALEGDMELRQGKPTLTHQEVFGN